VYDNESACSGNIYISLDVRVGLGVDYKSRIRSNVERPIFRLINPYGVCYASRLKMGCWSPSIELGLVTQLSTHPCPPKKIQSTRNADTLDFVIFASSGLDTHISSSSETG
jgi:hypothetical protein